VLSYFNQVEIVETLSPKEYRLTQLGREVTDEQLVALFKTAAEKGL